MIKSISLSYFEFEARFVLIINWCLMHKQRKSSMMHKFIWYIFERKYAS
jgi:hypothetical protein